MRAVCVVALAVLAVGCGPVAIGAGIAAALDDNTTDPTSPALQVTAHEPGTSAPLAAGAYVTFRVRDRTKGAQPVETGEPLRFRITPNKSGVSIGALLRRTGLADVGLDVVRAAGSLDGTVEVPPEQLVPDGDWTFVAAGVDGQGRTTTATFEFRVDTDPPDIPPVPIRAQARDAGTVLLEWLPTIEPGVAGYRIYEDVGGARIPDVRAAPGASYADAPPIEVPGGVDATSYLRTGLLGSRSYYFQVVAVDAAGNESPLSPEAERAVRTRSGGTGRFGTPIEGGRLEGEEVRVEPGDGTMERVVVADLDLDRKPDYVIGAGDRIYVVSDDGTVRDLPTGGDPGYRFAVGDVTNDRVPDLLVAGATENRLFAGRGDGTFEAPRALLPAPEKPPEEVVIVDLDEDGCRDFVTLVDTGEGNRQQLHWFRDAPGDDPERVVLEPFATNEGICFAVADVDGDRTKDLVGCAEQNINVRRGRLGPASRPASFGFASQDGVEGYVGAGGAVLSVQPVDLNGDGRLDFLCALANGRVSVVENEGLADEETLVLAPPRVFAVGAGPVRVATGDFNADGLPDIAAAEPGRGVVTVLLSRRGAEPDYRISQAFAVEGLADVAVADRNADGLLDLVAVTGAGTLEFWYGHGSTGRGDGGFRDTGVAFPARLKIGPAADLNGDGLQDVLALAVDQSFTLQTILGGGYQGQGDATFAFGPASQNLTTKFRTGLALGDVDDNGELDFFAAAERDIEVHASTAPTFQRSRLDVRGGSGFVRTPAVADVDRDRFDDLVLLRTDGTAALYRSTGAAMFFCADPTAGCASPTSTPLDFGEHRSDAAVVADVDGDGRLDIASLDVFAGRVRFLLGDAFGNFAPDPDLAPEVAIGLTGVANAGGEDAPPLLVSDLNGDGFPDLAAVSTRDDGKVAVAFGRLRGERGTDFLPTSIDLGPDFLREVHAVDIDRNGLLDLVVVADNRTYALLQTGLPGPLAFATPAVETSIPARPGNSDTNAAVLDFDGDGIPDLVASSDQGTRFWQGTGDVVTFPPQ